METGILKEPRGLMRILEWLFAILAFATCVHFTTYMDYTVHCSSSNMTVTHKAVYPFNLGLQAVDVGCGGASPSVTVSPPGDFSSDAQFFVFTGVISFLSTMAILIVYVFFASVYAGEDKRAPMMDFCFTVVIAVFWLSASAAWANGLSGIKSVLDGSWIYHSSESICSLSAVQEPVNTAVTKCIVGYQGSFGSANISVIFGFLNFFLWSANLWFLYKETSWFSGRASQQPQQMEG